MDLNGSSISSEVIAVYSILIQNGNGATQVIWRLNLGAFGRRRIFIVTLHDTDFYSQCWALLKPGATELRRQFTSNCFIVVSLSWALVRERVKKIC